MNRIYFQQRLSLNLRKLSLVLGVVLLSVCSSTAQTVETVSTGLNQPYGLALNGNDLYVAEYGSGEISKIDISQPLPVTATTLLTELPQVGGVIVIGDYLYFCSESNLPGFTSSVGRINLTSGTPTIEIVASNINNTFTAQAIVQNGNELYISATGNSPNRGIYKVDLTAPFPQDATVVLADVQVSGMAKRNNELYIGFFNGTEVRKFDIDNPNATLSTVVGGLSGPDGLCFNGNFLYISEFNGTTIQRIDVTEAAPVAETAVSGVSGASLVAFDGLDLYFSEFHGDKVSRVTLNEPVISAQPNICAGSSNNALGGASPTGGVYSGPGVTDNGDGETYTFNPTTAGGIGTYTITYTATNNSTATTTIEVVASPTVTFTLPAEISINAGTQTLNGSPAGGTYAGNGISDNTFNPSEAGIGSHTITYTYEYANGCGAMISETVNVVNSAEGCTTIHSEYIQWPTATVTPACTNSPEVITAEAETGEYSKVQVTAQVGYYFSSSVATDYITITNEDGTVIYTYGTGEVSITSAADQVVRFYLHLDDECNGSAEYRSRIVQCEGTVGVSELNKTNITYFPNPVNDILNVTSEEIISTIDVINMLGQTVVTKTANSTTSQIEMAQLPSGNYLVKVTSSTDVQTIRVMKQ